MVQGFKDKEGNFHPTGNDKVHSGKINSSTEVSPNSQMQTKKLKIETKEYDKLPEDFSFNDLLKSDKPHNYSDADLHRHHQKHALEAERLRVEIENETPDIIKSVTELKGYHEDAIRDADELINNLHNKNHHGNHLPLEYMDIEGTEIDNFIRDWSNVTNDNHGTLERHGQQNQEIVRHLSKLKAFKQKMDLYRKEQGETYG